MKHHYHVVLIGAAVALGAMAVQGRITEKQAVFDKLRETKGVIITEKREPAFKPTVKAPFRAEAEGVTVKFTIENEADYSLSSALALDKNSGEIVY